jgi:hypothetical protein
MLQLFVASGVWTIFVILEVWTIYILLLVAVWTIDAEIMNCPDGIPFPTNRTDSTKKISTHEVLCGGISLAKRPEQRNG